MPLADDRCRVAEEQGWAEWIHGPTDRAAVAEGCRFDLPTAQRARDFFSRFLRHSKGHWAGKPFDLLPWQWEHVVAPLFGWLRPNGTRRFRFGYISTPKKNGKSALFSAISIYLLVADNEMGAEVYSAAADRDQASIVFNEAANMVEASPDLSSFVQVIRSTKRLVFHRNGSFFRALSSEVGTKEGINAHAVLVDELHAQKTRDLWDALRYAGAARRQPLMLAITTAGYDKHSICYEQYTYAKHVRDGVIADTSFLSYVAEAEEADDWSQPATWRKANPSLGVTITEESFAADYQEASESPAKENSFRRYRLNQWTEQDVRWLPMDKWDACAEPLADLTDRPCWGGIDLSSTTDVSALVLVFPDDEGRYDVLPFFWVPEENARLRSRRDRVPYDVWAKQGLIEFTDGNVIDYDVIRKRVNDLRDKHGIRELAIDRWNATQLATQLQGDGFVMVEFGQGFASMNWPTKKLEELVLGGKLRHAGHPVLRWMAANTAAETDAADNWKPSKKKSTERIDGIVALIMALARATAGRAPEYPEPIPDFI